MPDYYSSLLAEPSRLKTVSICTFTCRTSSDSRNVSHTRILRRRRILLRQLESASAALSTKSSHEQTYHPIDLRRIHSRHVANQPLPFRDPAILRVVDRDESLENLGSAVENAFRGSGHFEKRFTVRATLLDELVLCLDEGADQAGAEGARHL